MRSVKVSFRGACVLMLTCLLLVFAGIAPAFAGPGSDIGSGGQGGGSGGGNGGGATNPNTSPPPQNGSNPNPGWNNPGSGDGTQSNICNTSGNDNLLFQRRCRTTTMTSYSAGGGCPARSGPGSYGGENIGYTTRTIQLSTRMSTDGEEWEPWLPWVTISHSTISCYYAESWNDVTLHCVDNTVLSIDKVAPNSRHIAGKTSPTAFAGNQTIQNCINSGQYISISAELDEFGRYLAQGATQGRTCTARYYQSSNDLTGSMPADTIIGCGGLYTIHSAESRMQIDCVNGVSNGFVNPAEFTAQACLDRDMAQAQCSVGGDPLFNDTARSNEVEAFRNGKPNTIEWDPVSITGSNVVDQKVTGTTLKRNGTPWNSQVGVNSDRQVAYVEHNGKNALGTKIPSNARKFDAGFYKASDGGDSSRFKLQPTYDLDVTLRTEKATITGYDPFGGLDYDVSPMNYSTTGDCTAEAINIDVLRSVNG